MKILDKLCGRMAVVAAGVTFRPYFILKSNFPLTFGFHAQLSDDALLYYTLLS
jgi:hypothetical protein